MNITRMGHYHVAPAGSDPEVGLCQAAVVTKVWSDTLVNLQVFGGELDALLGPNMPTSVPVEAPSTEHRSFHLSQDCPWKR